MPKFQKLLFMISSVNTRIAVTPTEPILLMYWFSFFFLFFFFGSSPRLWLALSRFVSAYSCPLVSASLLGYYLRLELTEGWGWNCGYFIRPTSCYQRSCYYFCCRCAPLSFWWNWGEAHPFSLLLMPHRYRESICVLIYCWLFLDINRLTTLTWAQCWNN